MNLLTNGFVNNYGWLFGPSKQFEGDIARGKRHFKAVLIRAWLSVHLFVRWTLEMLRDALEALRPSSRAGVRGYG